MLRSNLRIQVNQVEVDGGDDGSGESRLVREGKGGSCGEIDGRLKLRKSERSVHSLVDCSDKPANREEKVSACDFSKQTVVS